VAFAKARQNAQAIDCFRRAILLDPDLFAAHANLGTLLAEQGATDQALAALEMAVRLKPDSPEAHNNLANLLVALGQLDSAVEHCRQSLAIRPGNAQALNALGNALKDQGLLDEAIDAYARAARLGPDVPQPASNYLYALHFQSEQTPASLLAAHRDWSRRHVPPLKFSQARHRNDRDPERRLKIGYVSPDFREHPVGRFILPLLQNHDRKNFEVFCYANLHVSDAMTDCIRAHADVWRDIAFLSDEQACQMIESDRIDILVDLTMHLRSSRLLLFAAKPAPVQLSYLAYCSTTGLDAIHYRLTDPFLDPPGNDQWYVERSLRLPQTYWCYQANDAAPAVNALPATASGEITFSCLNNFCKISPPALATWSKLLNTIPNSRLILHTTPGTHCDRVRAALGIDPSRLSFVRRMPMPQYFAQYHRIDIALDPFPYTGGTTTCDALWMGVPVVSLAGKTAVSRGGLSILSNIGHADWVAQTIDDYLQIVTNLAGDLKRLAAIRASLRDQMRRSPLMDAGSFAREVEAAYRWMWCNYCRPSDNSRGSGG